MTAQDGPIPLQERPGEADRHDDGSGPTPKPERDRWHLAGNSAADDDVAGPKQAGKYEQRPGRRPNTTRDLHHGGHRWRQDAGCAGYGDHLRRRSSFIKWPSVTALGDA